jgi:rhodanese-related sulfurtransferase
VISTLRKWFALPGSMTAADARDAVGDGAVLVDVRGRDEWRAGHAMQATHIPLTQLTKRLIELPADGKIILVCRSGHRSVLGAVVLQRKGAQVSNITGGMNAWAAAGLLVVTDDGAAGRSV